jgi:predicted transglutaminase-like cysteine proteinase
LAVCGGAVGFPGSPGNASGLPLARLQPAAFAPVARLPDRPPAAWPDYCGRHPQDCRTDLRQPLAVPLTAKLFSKIRTVNLAVNRGVRPLTDAAHWGVEDRWDLAEDGYGDCEDYQLLKRKRLVDLGVPRRAMLMTVVRDEENNGHAVLMIRTTMGDLVLDNRDDAILFWKDTGYRFVQRESQYGAGWVDIEDLPETTAVVAARQGQSAAETTAAQASRPAPVALYGPGRD